MRKEKELTALLRGLADLLAEEADCNPAFAKKLEQLLTVVPARGATGRVRDKKAPVTVPDLHVELAARGESDLLLWLRELPVSTLKSLIRANDYDPAHRTAKWSEAEKLATFIVDNLRARMARGSAFMGRGQT